MSPSVFRRDLIAQAWVELSRIAQASSESSEPSESPEGAPNEHEKKPNEAHDH